VLTTYEGDEDIFQAMEAGATGYLVKGMPQEMLVNAVKKFMAEALYPSARVPGAHLPYA